MKNWCWGAVAVFLSCSAPAQEASHCKILKLASLPIDFSGLQPSLHAKFNGVDLHLVMDSGATTTTLFPSAVHDAGLEEIHSDLTSVGVGGMVHTFVAFAKDVEIGPSRGTNLRFLGTSETQIHGADGLLGADYLFRTDLELMLRDKQVVFLQAEGCGGGPISYWDPDAPWIESHDVSGMDLRQQVDVRINGHVFTALLDSGAQRSVLDLNAAAKIGLAPESEGIESAGELSGVGSRKQAVWRARIESFEIGPEAIRNTKIQIADLYGAARNDHGRQTKVSGADMILGADFIRAHHLLFARSQHRLYFTYLGGQVFSLEAAAAPSSPPAQ